MFEGLWIVQFAGMEGKGGGVVVLQNGIVLGGDSGYTYEGRYAIGEKGIEAKVRVHNFDPKIGNVIGIKGDYELTFSLEQKSSTVLEGKAALAASAGVGIIVRLTKRSDLVVE
jgi:T3SS negative regulator,GrlR